MSSISLPRSQFSRIHDPGVQAVMYAFLMVATPFILLRNYLVQGVARLSGSSIPLGGLDVKIVPVTAFLVLIASVIIFRKRISKLLLLSIAIVLILDTLAQQVTDFYFGHKFYDLQQNWHYIAYALYSFMVYRALDFRRLPIHRIMLITFFSAMAFSAFDEFFQMFMSSRVFDVCDIGKDVWGAMMGMVVIYLCGRHSQSFFKDWKNIRHSSIFQYYRHPFTLYLMLLIYSYIFLNIGSLLTEAEYAPFVVLITILVFSLFFVAWHVSQYRIGKIILLSVLIFGAASQAFSFYKYRNENVVYNCYGLTVYKGIPIPFFDIMIYSNGSFRLVDKKHFFNQRDRDFLFQRKSDIILIGSGSYGQGGKGFIDPQHLFIYNKWTGKATQVIIQKNSDAVQIFNRLKSENKNVLFILHNTC